MSSLIFTHYIHNSSHHPLNPFVTQAHSSFEIINTWTPLLFDRCIIQSLLFLQHRCEYSTIQGNLSLFSSSTTQIDTTLTMVVPFNYFTTTQDTSTQLNKILGHNSKHPSQHKSVSGSTVSLTVIATVIGMVFMNFEVCQILRRFG